MFPLVIANVSASTLSNKKINKKTKHQSLLPTLLFHKTNSAISDTSSEMFSPIH